MSATQIQYAYDLDGTPTRPQLSACCNTVIATGYGEPRCANCGHRQAIDGVPPVETRRKPFWLWPGELFNRYRAQHINPAKGPDYTVDHAIHIVVWIAFGMAAYAVIMATVALFIN